jgi:hypothetical protein
MEQLGHGGRRAARSWFETWREWRRPGGGTGGIIKRASGGNDGIGGFPEMRLKLIAAVLPVGGQGCPVALACAAFGSRRVSVPLPIRNTFAPIQAEAVPGDRLIRTGPQQNQLPVGLSITETLQPQVYSCFCIGAYRPPCSAAPTHDGSGNCLC